MSNRRIYHCIFYLFITNGFLLAVTSLSPYIGLGEGDNFFFYKLLEIRRSSMFFYELIFIIPLFIIMLIFRFGDLFFNGLKNYKKSYSRSTYASILFIFSCLWFFFFGKHTAFEWTTISDIPALISLLGNEFLKHDFYTSATINSPKDVFHRFLMIPTFLKLDWYSAIYLYKVIISILIKSILFLCSLSIIQYVLKDSKIKFKNYYLLHLFLFLIIITEIIYFQGEPAGWPSVLSIVRVSAYAFSLIAGMVYLWITFQPFRRIKFIFEIILLALSVCLHPLIGISIFMIMFIYRFSVFGLYNNKRLLIKFIFGVLFPIAFVILKYHNPDPISATDFIQFYVFDRHPHHYKMSEAVGEAFYVWLILYLVLCGLSLKIRERKIVLVSFLSLLFYLGSVILQYLGTEVFEIKNIAALGISRFTTFTSYIFWINLIILLIKANLFDKLDIYLKNIISQIRLIFNWPHTILELRFLNTLTSFCQFCFLRLFQKKHIAYPLIILSTLYIWKITIVDPLDWKYYKVSPPKSMFRWIKLNTPKDSVIFIDKLYYSFLIRCFAERASFVDTAMPFNESYFEEYFARLEIYDDKDSFGPEQYFLISEEHPLTHLMIHNSKNDKFGGVDPRFHSDEWSIYDIKDFSIKN